MMTIARRFLSPIALPALVLLFAAVPVWVQAAQLTGSNVAPLEGPAAGADTVLVYESGLQGTGTAIVTTDANWITVTSTMPGSSSMNIQNGPNRFQFQFPANTGATRTEHIILQPVDGSLAVTITVTQAGAGFAPAKPVLLTSSVIGPQGLDVDSQGNLYIVDVSGANLYEWTSATQQLSTLATRPSDSLVDVALDSAGNLFALENTPDGNYGTQVEQILAAQGQTLPPNNIVFSSEANQYEFPIGLCIDPAGKNLNVTTVDVSNKCLIDQFGQVYELDTTDDIENLGSFASPPTNAQYKNPPIGKTFFPVGTFVDPCGTQLSGVSGSLYGLSKDGNGFVYFVDQNGTRLNRYDPSAPFYTCTPPPVNGVTLIYPSYASFTTVAALTYPAYYAAADVTGNIYLSEMAFSRVEELPRAYLSSPGPFNEPLGGGTDTIQILPATQNLTGVFAPVSSDTTWLTVVSAASGVVTFSFAPNAGPSRTATITVLGVPVQVVQAESQTPATMTIVAGNNQQGAVGGLPFAVNPLVKVTNQWGDAVANVTVTFTSQSQKISVTTDQRGYATASGVTAYAVGPNSLTASIPGTGISQTFTMTAVQSGISIISGSNQQAEITEFFGSIMTVQVIGANGQPLAGVPVTFSAPASGASGTFSGPGSTTTVQNTFADGTASTAPAGSFRANTALGSYAITASIAGVPGVTSTSCNFNLTNFGPLQELVGNQSALVNNAYASPLSLKVLDSNGNPIPNVSVNFVVGFGGGNGTGAVFPDGTSSILLFTGPDGIVTAPSMTATATAGTFSASGFVTFPNNGGTLTAGWTLTNLPSTILEGALQTGLTTRTLTEPFIVQASANATAGSMVFTVVPGPSGAGGSFNGQSSVTVSLDSQGYGNSPLLTANGTPGTFTVTANDGVTTVESSVTTTPCLNPNTPSVVVTSVGDYDPQKSSFPDVNSLRYNLANACAGSNIDMTQLSNATISMTSRLRIDDNMTITGPVSNTVTLNGGGKTRLFFMGNGTVTISNLTLENGLALGGLSVFGGGGAGMGGAIFLEGGNLTLTNMIFTGNKAQGGGSGVASQCTTNCLYGGGGFAGDAGNDVFPELGGNSGDLFGVPGNSNGASGNFGGGGAGTGVLPGDTSANGGNGGFGAGGGAGIYNATPTSSGNGGFGGGGAGGFDGGPRPPGPEIQLLAGAGGYGAGDGYEPPFQYGVGPYANFGGSGAGFGGAIFEYAGQLTLNGVTFLSNSAIAGTLSGLSGQPTVTGQGKGGALFIYNGGIVINNGATFGSNGTNNIAADAGSPGKGNSAAPYIRGATCPGEDTADICGIFGNSAAVTITVPTGLTFIVNSVTYSGSQTLNLPQGSYTLAAPGPLSTGTGSQIGFSSWSDGGAPSHTITVGPGGLSISGAFATQYLLTVSAGAGGSAVPASSTYYNTGSVVNLNALSNVGSVFTNWTGTVAAANSAVTTVTMNAPQTVMANFTLSQPVSVNVPPGISFTLNGTLYTGSQFLQLAPGQYPLSTSTPQLAATADQQLLFNSWSDGGAVSHTITVGSSGLFISGTFSTQYQLTATAGSGGTILPVTGFYGSATVVNLTATPNPGYVFHNWTGMVASPSLATTTVTLNQAAAVTANFWLAPSACVAAPANVAGWWKGDATANDETALYNASLGGDVSFAPGLVGQAFSFDGTQSPFVSIPAGVFPPQPISSAFSFEAWFQTSGGNGGVILGQQDVAPYATPAGWNPAIYVGNGGDLYVEMFYNGAANPSVSPVPVNDNQWHHVAVTYDGNSEIVYLDGANIGQYPVYTQAPNGSTLSYQLGTGYTNTWPAANNGWYTFNGLIDEPTVYSRALTAAEVLGIAQAGSYGKCDPVAAASSTTLTFPPVANGQTATQSAKISNPGNAPLSISSIVLDNGDTQFTILSGVSGDCAAGTPVAPGASCNLRVQFTSQGGGVISGQVSLMDNAPLGHGTQVISLISSPSLSPQTITFGNIATQTVGTPLTLMATATSGLAVSYSSSTPTVCSVTGNIASFLSYGSCTIAAAQSGNATYSAANPVSQTFPVLSPQTVTFPGIGSQMLGTPLILTATASSGLPVAYAASPSGVCTVSGSTVTFAAAGTCTIKASQAGNANYLAAAPVTESFTVGKEAQSITWATIPAQTVQQTVTLTASASSGLPVTFASSSPAVCTVSGSTASLIAGGNCTLKATQAGNGTYSSQTVSQSFTVNKLTQSLTFGPIASPQTIGAQATFSVSSTSGLAVAVAPSPTTVCTVSGTAVSFVAAGNCKLTATQSGNSTFAAATAVSQIIVVGKDAQTISFGAIPNQSVGGSLALTASATSGLTVTYTATPSSVCKVSGSSASFAAAGTCTVTATQTGNSIYAAASPVPQSFLVSKLAQTISFGSIGTQILGRPLTLTATASSGLAVSYSATPSSVCKVSGSTATMVASGICTITASQAGSSIYTAATPVPESFTVNKMAQTITFGAILTQTVGTPLTLTATASSGLTLTYTASPSNICKVSGSVATMLGAGVCNITAAQSGNAQYSAATKVVQSFSVVP